MPQGNMFGLNFSHPAELLLLLTQLLCYLNQYYLVVFMLGPLPFYLILLITLANSRGLAALLHSNSTHLPATAQTENAQFCKKCKSWIWNRDHHCMFTGRCVQKGNYRYFISYVFYSYLLSCVLVASILANYELLINLRELQYQHSVPLVLGLISGLFFLVFTGGLLGSSFRSIVLGIYTVDEIKKVKSAGLTNGELRRMWFSREGRKRLWRAFGENWKKMVGEDVGLKDIVVVM